MKESPSTALANGHWGLGQVVARQAMQMATGRQRLQHTTWPAA